MRKIVIFVILSDFAYSLALAQGRGGAICFTKLNALRIPVEGCAVNWDEFATCSKRGCV